MERTGNHLVIAHFDSMGMFQGFNSSLAGYHKLRECSVVSCVSLRSNDVGVDIYKDGTSEYYASIGMKEAMSSLFSQNPTLKLYRIGFFEGRAFSQAIYIFAS